MEDGGGMPVNCHSAPKQNYHCDPVVLRKTMDARRYHVGTTFETSASEDAIAGRGLYCDTPPTTLIQQQLPLARRLGLATIDWVGPFHNKFLFVGFVLTFARVPHRLPTLWN